MAGFWKSVFNNTVPVPVVEQRAASSLVLPPSRNAIPDVNVENALGIATVFRSVNLISTSIAQLSLETFRGNDKIENPTLVNQPDYNRSLSNFLKRTATCLATNGNAYWKVTKNAAGQVNNIEVLNPLLVQIQFSERGFKTYKYGEKTWSDKQVQHLRYSEIPGHDYGVGPIEAYSKGLRAALGLRDFQNDFLGKSGIPTGLLSTNLELDSDVRAEIKKAWHESQKDGGIAVLSNGLDFKALTMSAADMQFVETANLSDLQIARIFGIDPVFLALSQEGGSSLTYTNRQDLDVQFIRYTLMQYLIEIEDAFSACMPRGTYVKFNVKDFIRAYEANNVKETANAAA